MSDLYEVHTITSGEIEEIVAALYVISRCAEELAEPTIASEIRRLAKAVFVVVKDLPPL